MQSGILWHRRNSFPPQLRIFRTARLTSDLARAEGSANVLQQGPESCLLELYFEPLSQRPAQSCSAKHLTCSAAEPGVSKPFRCIAFRTMLFYHYSCIQYPSTTLEPIILSVTIKMPLYNTPRQDALRFTTDGRTKYALKWFKLGKIFLSGHHTIHFLGLVCR